MYTILKSRKKRYLKKTVYLAFCVMEKYNKELLQFCGEIPYLPLTAEEVFSDLVVDRMPRFIQNCENTSQQQLEDLIKYDLTAVKSEIKYKANIIVLKERLEKEMEVLKSDAGIRRKRTARKRLALLKKQFLHIQFRKDLCLVEKRFLGYLRACIRNTKVNYLQQKTKSKEGQSTRTVDPNNGLQEHPEGENKRLAEERVWKENVEEVKKKLAAAGLGELEIQVIVDVVIYDRNYESVGRRLGVSDSTAARYYQLTMCKLQQRSEEIGRLFNVE